MNKEDYVIFVNHMPEEFRYWVKGFHHKEYGMVVQEVSISPSDFYFVDSEARNKDYFVAPSDYNPLGKNRRKAKPYPVPEI